MWAKPKKQLLSYADAYNFSLDRLAARDHSSAELLAKLQEWGCPPDICIEVLSALRARHFIDDGRCAEAVAAAWRQKKYYGRAYLRLMLTKRQNPPAIAGPLAAAVTEEEERERAEAFARAELPALRRRYAADARKGKAALARKLASRGFGSGTIADVLDCYGDPDSAED